MIYYVIYYKPLDFPNHWVVRKFTMHSNMSVEAHEPKLFTTLNASRESIPKGRVCFLRNDEDDPVIIETWI